MRILIVKLGSIGDVVHTLPALAAMRRALPDAEISWLVERGSAEILRDNPDLDRLIDLALDFQGLLKSATVARLSGARRIFGFDSDGLREPASRFLLHQKISIPPRLNVIRKNLTLARAALGISAAD